MLLPYLYWCRPYGGGDKGTVFYLSPNQFDEFQTTASQLLEKYVTGAGYNFKQLVAGNKDAALQLNQLDNIILLKPKAIIMAPVDPIAIVAGVEKARAAGIAIIAFDRTVSQTKVDFTSVAGCYKMGVLSANEMVSLLQLWGSPNQEMDYSLSVKFLPKDSRLY